MHCPNCGAYRTIKSLDCRRCQQIAREDNKEYIRQMKLNKTPHTEVYYSDRKPSLIRPIHGFFFFWLLVIGVSQYIMFITAPDILTQKELRTNMEGLLTITLMFYPLYMLPSFLSRNKEESEGWIVLLVNFFAGWTVIAWFSLLSTSMSKAGKHKKDYIPRSSSSLNTSNGVYQRNIEQEYAKNGKYVTKVNHQNTSVPNDKRAYIVLGVVALGWLLFR